MAANERQVGGTHYKVGAQYEEHWDRVWRLFGRGYFVGQITKYAERYAYKDGLKDLEKLRHFVEKLIELENSNVAPGLQYKEAPWPLEGAGPQPPKTEPVLDDAPPKKVARRARRR